MKLRKAMAIGWLAISVLPIVYFPLSSFLMSSSLRLGSPDATAESFDLHFKLTTYAIYFGWILVISYIAYMYRTDYVPKTKRGLWLAVLLFVNVFALPFFWFHYVWQPIQNPSSMAVTDESRPKSKVPVVFGLVIFLIFPFSYFLMSFQDGQSFDYLSSEFPLSDGSRRIIDAGEVSIAQPLKMHGSGRLNNVFTVSLTDETVKFEPNLVRGAFYSGFEIPASAVHSCSRQCGIGKEYILILEDAATKIGVFDAPELMNWCWQNQLPMLLSSDRRKWLYKGTSLPSRDELADSMVSRESYDQKARRACQGY